jgi:hypothetical protein
MRHTKWIDVCCENFSTTVEYPTDPLLKTLIDIELVAREAERMASCRSVHGGHGTELGTVQKVQSRIRNSFSSGEVEVHGKSTSLHTHPRGERRVGTSGASG